METKAKRFNSVVTKQTVGPANYDTLGYKAKESFNYGQVAFGSHSNIQLFDGTRKTSHVTSLSIAPGPGSYQNNFQQLKQKVLAQNAFGSKEGLMRDNSGVRQFSHLPKAEQFKVAADQKNFGDDLNTQISVMSLKKPRINANGIKSGADYLNSMLEKDNSVTHLPNVGLIAQPSEKALFKTPRLSITNGNHHIDLPKQYDMGKGQLTLEQKIRQSPSKSVIDLYNKDLGTMGIPREIAALRQDQNFLFIGDTDSSPGQYNPQWPSHHSPSAMFGSDTTKPRVQQKPGQKEKLDEFLKSIILEPSHITNKRKNAQLKIETFESAQKNKLSHQFSSVTQRRLPTENGQQNQVVAPGSYESYLALDSIQKRKDFQVSQPKIDVPPVREMTYQKASTGPNDEYLGFLSYQKHVEKPYKPIGVGQLSNAADPLGIKGSSHIEQEAIKKRFNHNVIGPGSYDPRPPGRVESEPVNQSIIKKPPPAFSSATPRFDFDSQARQQRSRPPQEDVATSPKPIYELQLLEGPQMKAKRMFETIETNQQHPQKPKLSFGSVHRSGHIDRLLDNQSQPPQTTRHNLQRLSPQESSAALELSIMQSKDKLQKDIKLKDDLVHFMKQEEQLISFNSAVPRFQSNASHQIRLLPAQEGSNNSGIDFVMKRDVSQIGPGTYLSADQIEEKQKQKKLQHKLPAGSGFGSSEPREKHDYVSQQLKQSPFLGQVGQSSLLPAQSSVIKKSFNVNLSPKSEKKHHKPHGINAALY